MNSTRCQFLETVIAAMTYNPPIEDSLLDVRTLRQWARSRQKILANMQLVMGPLPKRRKAALAIQRLGREDFPTFTRERITYVSEPGDRVPAYLLKPKRLKSRVPAMLCLHQTIPLGAGEPAGMGGNRDLHYAQELAERGYVTLAPDYPGFGGYQFDAYQHGYKSTTMKGIWNHICAVDLLRSLPEVSPDRIGCIGHSLGGHNTLFVGAFDTRIRVLVSSCGFTSFRKYYGGNLAGWSQQRYMPLIAEKYGNNPARMPFDFSDVLAVLAPRPVFINAPLHDANFDVSGVRDCVTAARQIYVRIFHAGNRLMVVHPDAAHSFPPAARRAAYAFIDRWLKRAV